MEQTAARLESHMQDILDRMMSNSSATLTQEDTRHLARLREEWETVRKCRDICSSANQHLKENISVINNHTTGNEAVQFLVSNSQQTIHNKNRGHRNQLRKIGGHFSDQSIHEAVRDYLQKSIQESQQRFLSAQQKTSSIPDELEKFKVDAGAYSQPRASSDNFVFPLEEFTDNGTRPTNMIKCATTTSHRLL